jgi:glycosyltransferase involved in cell wall biosynthesis
MKILMVNRCGYSAYGIESYFLNLCELLRQKGHTVIVFTTKDERNIDKQYSDYFVEKIDNEDINSIPINKKISYIPKTIYSLEAQRKIERLILDTRPDIAHLHGINRFISPSILPVLKRFNLPVVYGLYDSGLICPNYRLFSKGKICQACKGNKFYNVIINRCVRDSLPLSLLAGVEYYIHSMFNMFSQYIDAFVVPSLFLKRKMVEYGFNPSKFICIPHFIFFDQDITKHEFRNYIVYFGRLVEEKGLFTLLMAIKQTPEVKLLLIGDGTYKEALKKIAAQEKIKNIEFLGYLQKENIKEAVRDALGVIVPSIWYDASPLVIYESFAMGKAVVGSAIGGIPELIDDGVNGLLFKAGDVDNLAEKIKYLFQYKDKISQMGENARKKAASEYSPDVHYEKILDLYQNLIRRKQQ